jgi:hypothetical protein
VFVTLLDADRDEVLGKETATTFEPKTDHEPAHFARASFDVPDNAARVRFRYRIALPGETPEFTEIVTVDVDRH